MPFTEIYSRSECFTVDLFFLQYMCMRYIMISMQNIKHLDILPVVVL